MRKTILPVSLLVFIPSFVPAQDPPRRNNRPLAEFSAAIEDLAQSASPAVVQITVQTRTPVGEGAARKTGFLASRQATGSGVIIDADGYIVTNSHVVEGARHIDVSALNAAARDGLENHNHFVAKVVGVDHDTDLAVLKIEAKGLPTLAFRDSSTVRQGQFVVALGSPLGLENSLSVGFVSAPVRHLEADQPMFYIQTDAAINPGNSGGPLLDIDGRIVGINTLILSQSGGSEGIGFAIPSNLVMDVYEHLRKEGRIRRGAIGVIPDDITPVLAAALGLGHHAGVILSDVAPHSAAEAAGLQLGDIVLAVNGHPVRETRQFAAAMFERAVGDEVTLEIERNRAKQTIKVTIMERATSPGGLTQLANDEGQLIRRLGVLVLDLNEKTSAILGDLRRLSGVVVGAIPAEYVGLNPGLTGGDVIYEFNGKRIGSVEELRNALASAKVGDPVALLVERSEQLVYVSFELE